MAAGNNPIPVPQPGASFITKFVQSDLYRNLYCNNVRVTVSQWDLGLAIGHIVENEEGISIVREEASVKFSPPFFKVLVGSFTAALQQWEATFGEIPVGLGQAHNATNMSNLFEALKVALEPSGATPPEQ